MRAHIASMMDSLLFATKEKAIEESRRTALANRERYIRATA
jgi:GntR family transcriptional repressor for pyruvate dehydrogenase complex